MGGGGVTFQWGDEVRKFRSIYAPALFKNKIFIRSVFCVFLFPVRCISRAVYGLSIYKEWPSIIYSSFPPFEIQYLNVLYQSIKLTCKNIHSNKIIQTSISQFPETDQIILYRIRIKKKAGTGSNYHTKMSNQTGSNILSGGIWFFSLIYYIRGLISWIF